MNWRSFHEFKEAKNIKIIKTRACGTVEGMAGRLGPGPTSFPNFLIFLGIFDDLREFFLIWEKYHKIKEFDEFKEK